MVFGQKGLAPGPGTRHPAPESGLAKCGIRNIFLNFSFRIPQSTFRITAVPPQFLTIRTIRLPDGSTQAVAGPFMTSVLSLSSTMAGPSNFTPTGRRYRS